MLKIRIEFFPISDEVIQPVEVTTLKSLTEFENPAIKYFAGKAKYTINFSAPDFVSASDSILLDLGKLSATSEVILNGKLLAYPWQSNTRLVCFRYVEGRKQTGNNRGQCLPQPLHWRFDPIRKCEKSLDYFSHRNHSEQGYAIKTFGINGSVEIGWI